MCYRLAYIGGIGQTRTSTVKESLNQLTHGLRQAGLDIGHNFQYEDPDVDDGPPEVHHIIARSQKEYFVLGTWL